MNRRPTPAVPNRPDVADAPPAYSSESLNTPTNEELDYHIDPSEQKELQQGREQGGSVSAPAICPSAPQQVASDTASGNETAEDQTVIRATGKERSDALNALVEASRVIKTKQTKPDRPPYNRSNPPISSAEYDRQILKYAEKIKRQVQPQPYRPPSPLDFSNPDAHFIDYDRHQNRIDEMEHYGRGIGSYVLPSSLPKTSPEPPRKPDRKSPPVRSPPRKGHLSRKSSNDSGASSSFDKEGNALYSINEPIPPSAIFNKGLPSAGLYKRFRDLMDEYIIEAEYRNTLEHVRARLLDEKHTDGKPAKRNKEAPRNDGRKKDARQRIQAPGQDTHAANYSRR